MNKPRTQSEKNLYCIKFDFFNPTEKVIDTYIVELNKFKLFVYINYDRTIVRNGSKLRSNFQLLITGARNGHFQPPGLQAERRALEDIITNSPDRLLAVLSLLALESRLSQVFPCKPYFVQPPKNGSRGG